MDRQVTWIVTRFWSSVDNISFNTFLEPFGIVTMVCYLQIKQLTRSVTGFVSPIDNVIESKSVIIK